MQEGVFVTSLEGTDQCWLNRNSKARWTLMKTQSLISAIIITVATTTGLAQIPIYEDDFSSPPPVSGNIKITYGSVAFDKSWSLTESIPAIDGNPYGSFIADVTIPPGSASYRWYGGYFGLASSPLPSAWSLSFVFRESDMDPIRIQVLQGGVAYTDWITPAVSGWTSVNVSSQDFTPGPSDLSPQTAEIQICMASHDSNGNPLSMSGVGTYELDLDNILLVPEPTEEAFLFVALIFTLGLANPPLATIAKGMRLNQTQRTRR